MLEHNRFLEDTTEVWEESEGCLYVTLAETESHTTIENAEVTMCILT